MRLKLGLRCQTLCAMKSWLFCNACFCIGCHGLRFRGCPFASPALQPESGPAPGFHVPGTMLLPTSCHSRVFSFKEVFIHNDVLL